MSADAAAAVDDDVSSGHGRGGAGLAWVSLAGTVVVVTLRRAPLWCMPLLEEVALWGHARRGHAPHGMAQAAVVGSGAVAVLLRSLQQLVPVPRPQPPSMLATSMR